MIGIAEEELQGVFARRQLDAHFGLAGAEMEMVLVVRDRLIERRQVRVDDEMVMPGIGAIDAGGRDAGTAQSHAQPEFSAGNDGPVRGPDDIGGRPLRRRFALVGARRAPNRATGEANSGDANNSAHRYPPLCAVCRAGIAPEKWRRGSRLRAPTYVRHGTERARRKTYRARIRAAVIQITARAR